MVLWYAGVFSQSTRIRYLDAEALGAKPPRCTRTRGKRDPAQRPGRPAAAARQQAPGYSTFATDRPPIAGVIGRESEEVRLGVLGLVRRNEQEAVINDTCLGEVVALLASDSCCCMHWG